MIGKNIYYYWRHFHTLRSDGARPNVNTINDEAEIVVKSYNIVSDCDRSQLKIRDSTFFHQICLVLIAFDRT